MEKKKKAIMDGINKIENLERIKIAYTLGLMKSKFVYLLVKQQGFDMVLETACNQRWN